MKNYLIIILTFANSIVFAQATLRLPIVKGTRIQKGIKYVSQSGKHYLLFQNDGNLVVMTSSNQKVWGLDEVFSNFNKVNSIQLLNDANLVARNSSNGFLWSALSENTNSGSQLIVNGSGVLQLIAPGNEILWASDGELSSNEFVIDYGWRSYRLLNEPKIIIMGSRAVTPIAMNVIADTYIEITKRLTTKYPKNRFDGYIIYVTNGEPWSELKNLNPVGTMWRDQTGTKSGDYLRGGTSFNYLWIDEQMICKKGVRTRNEAFAAGLLAKGDNDARTFDQVVHEFGHAIDFKFNLRSRILEFYKGGWNPVEQFPWSIQNYNNTPGGKLIEKEVALMKEIFTEKTIFSCNTYYLKSVLNAGETLKTGETLLSPNQKYILVMLLDGNLCIYRYNNGQRGDFVWGTYQTKQYNLGEDYKLTMRLNGNLCVTNKNDDFRWGSYQVKNYALTPGCKLVLTDNGKLNILNSEGQIVWVN